MHSLVLIERWHVFYAHCKVSYLQVFLIYHIFFSFDKNFEQADVEDNPEAYHKVENADCDSQSLSFDGSQSS